MFNVFTSSTMVEILVSNSSMNQVGKFFSSNIIGFRGSQSFVAMNESLSMSCLFFKDKT
jgi:hypothetical protein